MKRELIILALLAAGGFLATANAQVRAPEDRLAVLETARTTLEPEVRPFGELVNDIVQHPFHPRMDSPVEGPAVRTTLAEIAGGIRIDGSIQMGGVRYLLVHGRRVGPGEYLPVEYEGRTYQLRVEEIRASSVTLRLNDEEIERNL